MWSISNICLILTAALVLPSYCIDIPSYIHVCHRNDPKVKECIKKSANIAIPEIVKGSKEFDVPSMAPLKIDKVEVSSGNNMVFSVTDLTLSGLESAIFTDGAKEGNHMYSNYTFDKLEVTGTYDIDGQILVLPIKGHGPIKFNMYKPKAEVNMDCDLVEKDGQKYLRVLKSTTVLTSDKVDINLGNLFNGDKTLGDEMNKFLNENWEEVHKEIDPAIMKVVNEIIIQLLNKYLSKIPYDAIYPE